MSLDQTKTHTTDQTKTHTTNNFFLCDVCGKKYSTMRTLTVHFTTHTKKTILFTIHTGKTPKCSECEKTNKQHIREKWFSCDVCRKKFLKKCDLTRHMGTHRVKRLKCQLCGNRFRDEYNLTLHLKSIHMIQPLKTNSEKKYDICGNKQQISPKSLNNFFTCFECGTVFKSITSLDEHLLEQFTKDISALDLITPDIHFQTFFEN